MPKKYKIITYGCQMNIHESEKIAGILINKGYIEAMEDSIADIYVYNTCCIRDNAEKRAYGNIGALKPLKKINPNIIIAVCGCMTQQDKVPQELIAKFPFVDIIIGTHNLDKLGEFLDARLYKGKKIIEVIDSMEINENVPIYRTSGCNAWVNIIYGCNNYCTYCIVPYVRGREKSRQMELILNNINTLINEGYKEITLIGQNVNSYGNDLNDDKTSFAELLKNIAKIDSKFRLRFLTSHPKDINDEIINIIASSPNICNNIHFPVQSGSNRILKLMNRKYDREHYLALVKKIRNTIPDCGITTDIMVGFPGETDEDFNDTLNLVKEVSFLSAFTFVYSSRKGTPASKLEQVDDEIKKTRIMELIKLQNSIMIEDSSKYLQNIYEVLCQGAAKKKGSYCGRTDNGKLVNFASEKDLTGQYVNVKIIKAKASVLIGEIEV